MCEPMLMVDAGATESMPARVGEFGILCGSGGRECLFVERWIYSVGRWIYSVGTVERCLKETLHVTNTRTLLQNRDMSSLKTQPQVIK